MKTFRKTTSGENAEIICGQYIPLSLCRQLECATASIRLHVRCREGKIPGVCPVDGGDRPIRIDVRIQI